ncbi:formate dehydrogenase accessory sulfurtransferase FdhD [Methanolobus chelungpuianus]|uniref:formate dehydrogenase accessory sulfurtransferase FdhD n=1 Tax=Methanolobus chelungpuianus TaxID=502115 RepID=UPI002114D8CC|nr:formate dehydrogenase accessory sulfurtransferase FdhD [Methanolobus chelungpuianus]
MGTGRPLKASGDEESPSPFHVSMKCLRITESENQYIDVDVIIEERFDLFVNGIHITTFFASPVELEELALGFLVCEGFIQPYSRIGPITITPDSISCTLDIDADELAALTHQQRCGTTDYCKDTVRRISSDVRFSKEAVIMAVEQLKEKGKAWHRTGGAHTSMVCNDQGEVLFSCEDVGRACSVDKVVGKALLNGTDLSQCALVTTGRLASTMVSKAINAGFPLVASKGATVREAVELARETGITLVAFVRRPDLYVYSGEQRINV